jgi:hypothetical protein
MTVGPVCAHGTPSGFQDDLAHGGVLVEAPMRLGRVYEGENTVDPGSQAPLVATTAGITDQLLCSS